jgi:pimeloyl-ACP methyl ester carboxylesterase
VAFVKPNFGSTPWYADHPLDLSKRQESHFLECVMPFVNRTQPVVKTKQGTFLVGFSKSGWGAFSLALRHPSLFAGIAVWDAPLMQAKPDRWDMATIFGSKENFERYRIETLLKEVSRSPFDMRIVLLGYSWFRGDVIDAHHLMDSLSIQHVFRDGPKRQHRWDSGWLPEAIDALFPSRVAVEPMP